MLRTLDKHRNKTNPELIDLALLAAHQIELRKRSYWLVYSIICIIL